MCGDVLKNKVIWGWNADHYIQRALDWTINTHGGWEHEEDNERKEKEKKMQLYS